jgi:transglutaminase-like putative cysteine protease
MQRLSHLGLLRVVGAIWAALIVFASSGFAQNIDTAYYPVTKVIQYGYAIQNTSLKVLKKAEFRTYSPVKKTSTQKVVKLVVSRPYRLVEDELGNQVLVFEFENKLVVSRPYRLVEDELGNQVLVFEFENMPPNGTKIISITAELALSNKPNSMPAPGSGFLGSEPYIEAQNEQIQTLAQTLIAETPYKTARNIQQWVSGNLKSESYIPDDRGALYALKHRSGDCTEFSYLFAALGRADGIPVRVLGGYVYENNATLKASDYHNWAEFYTDGVWQIADPQKKNFAVDQASYVAMRVISPGGKGILGNSHRFSYVGEGVRVTMQ